MIESMLLALDHLYGAVYFHRTVRAATTMLHAVLSRVAEIADQVLPADDPMLALLTKRKHISLHDYQRVNDATFWHHLDRWAQPDVDRELRFFCDRFRRRELPKHLGLPKEYSKTQRLEQKAKELVRVRFPESYLRPRRGS